MQTMKTSEWVLHSSTGEKLPDTLESYICDMAGSTIAAGCRKQEFILEPIDMGYGFAQSIIQVLPRCKVFRHVHGLQPVKATVSARLIAAAPVRAAS